MSILKHVSGHNYSKKTMAQLINYATEAYKTGDGKYIYTHGCSKKDIHKDMNAIKRAYHKEGGKQGEHFVISISPDDKRVSDNDYIEIGRKIAEFYDEYQSVVALHKDSKVRHLHLVLNSTSFNDGKKFSQSPSKLNAFKESCNKILDEYGLDLINNKTTEITDTNHYSFDDDNLDFLEILEEIPVIDSITESTDTYCPDNSEPDTIYIEFDECLSELETEKTEFFSVSTTTLNNESEDYPMSDYTNYYGFPTNSPNPNTAPNTYGYTNSPSNIQVNQLPNTPAIPNLTLDNSRNVNITVNNVEEINKVVHLMNSIKPISYDEKTANTNIAMAASAKLMKAGHTVNVILDNSTNFNINIADIPQEETHVFNADFEVN